MICPPFSSDAFLDWFAAQGLEQQTQEHAPLFTVADSALVHRVMVGGHCKNLFVIDKSGQSWLVVVEALKRVDLKQLSVQLAGGRLSFASPDLLFQRLGITPGSVSPFALIHDTQNHVRVVLDQAFMKHEVLHFHPLINTRTTAVSKDTFLRFLAITGHQPVILEVPAQLSV